MQAFLTAFVNGSALLSDLSSTGRGA